MATIFNRSTNVFCAEALSSSSTMFTEARKHYRAARRYLPKCGSTIEQLDGMFSRAETLSSDFLILNKKTIFVSELINGRII